MTGNTREEIQIQDGVTPMVMGKLTKLPYQHCKCLEPKPKQLQLYICSEAAEAIIDSLELDTATTALFKHKLWNLTSKSGWVHYHTYSDWMNTLLLPKQKMIRCTYFNTVNGLRSRLNRIKVGRKSA